MVLVLALIINVVIAHNLQKKKKKMSRINRVQSERTI